MRNHEPLNQPIAVQRCIDVFTAMNRHMVDLCELIADDPDFRDEANDLIRRHEQLLDAVIGMETQGNLNGCMAELSDLRRAVDDLCARFSAAVGER